MLRLLRSGCTPLADDIGNGFVMHAALTELSLLWPQPYAHRRSTRYLLTAAADRGSPSHVVSRGRSSPCLSCLAPHTEISETARAYLGGRKLRVSPWFQGPDSALRRCLRDDQAALGHRCRKKARQCYLEFEFLGLVDRPLFGPLPHCRSASVCMPKAVSQRVILGFDLSSRVPNHVAGWSGIWFSGNLTKFIPREAMTSRHLQAVLGMSVSAERSSGLPRSEAFPGDQERMKCPS